MKKRSSAGKFRCFYQTSVGAGAVVTSERGIIEVFLPFAKASADEIEQLVRSIYPDAGCSNTLSEKACRLLQQYFAGEKVYFDLEVDLSEFTPFQKRVYEAVAAIPYGCVKTYAEVAAEVGRKSAARGVGSAMARNPVPVIIPCHRVVGSSGTMTGYSAPGGVASKINLLVMEGLTIDKKRILKPNN